MELIHREQEKRSHRKSSSLSPLLKEPSLPVPLWLYPTKRSFSPSTIICILSFHKTDLPAGRQRGLCIQHCLSPVVQHALILPIIALLCHFEMKRKTNSGINYMEKKNTLFKKCLLIQIVLYRVCNFKISGILTSVFIMFLPSQVISCLFLNTVISIWYVLFSLWYCFCVFMTAYSRVIIFSTSQTVQTHIAKQRPYHWAKTQRQTGNNTQVLIPLVDNINERSRLSSTNVIL